jgi:hypothetical protein
MSQELEAAIKAFCQALIDAEPDHSKRMEYLHETFAALDVLRNKQTLRSQRRTARRARAH